MSLQIRLVRDEITPHLKKIAAGIKDKRPILEAMGLQLVSITKRAFNDASLRAASWPPKSDGSPATLKRKGALWQSIRIAGVTNNSVTVGSDRRYAAIHQFGGVIRPKNAKALRFFSGGRWWTVKKVTIPARPFFPFLGQTMTPLAQEKIRKVADAKVRKLLAK